MSRSPEEKLDDGYRRTCRPRSSPERTQLAIGEVLAGRRRGMSAFLPMAGPGGDRLDRLYGPRQLCDEHPGRREIWLWPALGRSAGQSDRDAVSGPVGEARHRHRPQPRRIMSRRISRGRSSSACGSSARSRRWRPILRNSSAARSASSLLFHLPLFWGMVVTGIVTYGILMFERRGFRPIELIIGALVGVIGLCFLIEMFIAPVDWAAAGFHSVVPQLARCGRHYDRRRHHRRHGHAACDLSPFRPHSGPHACRERCRSAEAPQLFQQGSRRRAGARRRRQYGDGDDGLRRLSPGPQRRCRDRDRLSYA